MNRKKYKDRADRRQACIDAALLLGYTIAMNGNDMLYSLYKDGEMVRHVPLVPVNTLGTRISFAHKWCAAAYALCREGVDVETIISRRDYGKSRSRFSSIRGWGPLSFRAVGGAAEAAET